MAGVVALCADLVFRDRMPYYRDVMRLFVPLRELVAAELRAGRLPLWNPHQWTGVPLWGDPQAAVLYPPHALFVLLPMAAAWSASILLHHLLAAAFTTWLLRSWGLRGAAALAGGLTYALGGALVSATSAPNMHAAAAWLPLALWMAQRAAAQRSLGAWMGAGLVLGVQALAGSAETSAMTVLAMLLYVTTGAQAGPRALVAARGDRLRALAGLVLALAVAAGIAAAHILPAEELSRLSARPHVTLEEAASHSLHPLRLLQLCLPRLWGSIPDGTYWGGFLVRAPAGAEHPLLPSVYAGILPWIVLAAAARRRQWPRGFAFALLGTCLVAALGEHTRAHALLYSLLPMPLRYPEKAMLGVAFASACVAAAGLDALAGRPRSRSALAVAAALLLAGTAAAVVGAAAPGAAEAWVPGLARRTAGAAAWRPAKDIAASGLHLALVALVALVALAAWRRHRSAWLVAVLAGIDLVVAGRAFLWTTPVSLYARPPRLAGALATPTSGADLVLREPGIEPPERLPYAVTTAAEAVAWWSYDVAFTNVGAAHGIRYADGYGPANLARVARVPLEAWPGLGLGSIVRRPGGSERSRRVAPHARARWADLDAEVAAVAAPRPRAYWTDGVRSVANVETALRLIVSGRVDTRAVTLIESDALVAPAPEGGARIVPAAIRSPHAARLEIDVRAPAPGWLVVNDSFYAGWRATVDGRPAAVVRANGLVRAVAVEAGEHRVVLDYRPRRVGIGLGLTAATLALVLAALARAATRPRPPARTPRLPATP